MTRTIRLGVNIDHVATIRNARGGTHPDPVKAALHAIAAGADGITAHLREDRRHIRDADMFALKAQISKPLNFEMAATDEMVRIALEVKPHAACLVPEKRTELTTEGGLDAAGLESALRPQIVRLRDAGIRVSLFVDPDLRQIDAAVALGAPVVELHTGTYAHRFLDNPVEAKREVERIRLAAAHAAKLGIECHAGHGLTVDNVGPIAAIPEIVEHNTGHFLIGEAVFMGLGAAIRELKAAMARGAAGG